MQIVSTNSGLPPGSGLSASSGLGSTLVPAARRPADDPAATEHTQRAAATAREAGVAQQVAPALALLNGEASRALVLARQRASEGGGYVQTDKVGSEAAAQRALAAYNTVAGQEQRYELDEMLVGIDVFV